MPGSPPRDDEQLEFGPSGYLPERASKRARKIVLRAPLGLQWVVGSLVAGVVVVLAGVLFLQRSAGTPDAPWVEVAEVAALAPVQVDDHLDVLLLTVGGRPRAFTGVPAGVGYCPETNRLEAPDGGSWALTGRGLGGAASLDEHPTLVQDGVLYVDPSRTGAGPPPSAEDVELGCH